MRIDLKFSAVLGIALFGVVAPATAQERVKAGLLACQSAGHTGYIIGSISQFSCVFRPDYGRPERYTATLSRFGADVGTTTSNALQWSVLAPSRYVGPGSLAGSYGGVGASATVGIGVGANLMIGGSQNSYALQPLSVQASTGFNAAGGLAGLELRPVRHSRRR